MRRWVIIFLLLVYPFQLALAMADRCCDLTAGGVNHHIVAAVADDGGAAAALPAVQADDGGGGAADPHCAACSFSHTAAAPPGAEIAPFAHQRTDACAAFLSSFDSVPAGRPERPQWPGARA